MDIPKSMQAELNEWNRGKGVDLESWVGCEGRFALAVGYSTLFWPEFEMIEGYILRKGTTPDVVAGFENQNRDNRRSVEATINHIHLTNIQYLGCPDCSADKLIYLGQVLKEIYEAKLMWQFPNHPCIVDLYSPENPEDLHEYSLSFWQKAHEHPSA